MKSCGALKYVGSFIKKLKKIIILSINHVTYTCEPILICLNTCSVVASTFLS